MISFCKKINFFYDRVRYRGAGIALFCEELDDTFSVLLGQRKYKPGKGLWSFPGGAVESGETALQTASREFLEETDTALPTLKARYVDVYKINMPFFHWETFLYATKSHASFKNIHEFTEINWKKEKEIQKLDLHFWVKPVCKLFRKRRSQKN
jgi:8-oxo-dGTP pyrophosphatase MutT (NUDIX family)